MHRRLARVEDAGATGARVGLVGFGSDTGLGLATRDFYTHLPFARWLVVEQPRFGVNRTHLDANCLVVSRTEAAAVLDEWLRGLDVVFAIQAAPVPGFWRQAKARRIRTVLMPNAEWFAPANFDMRLIDRFVAPTRACAELLHATGFGARTRYVPHPVDTERFAFRRRERAQVFLHCRGWGEQDRKGSSFVLQVARRCPEVSFAVRSQAPLPGVWPANVRTLGATAEPEEQYQDGDVAIHPSRYEGVGLPILEAMACGLPTIVTDAAPMNEFPADRQLCVPGRPYPMDLVGRPFEAYEADVEALVRLVRELHGQPIGELSAAARARMEERSWPRVRPALLEAIGFEVGVTPVPKPSADPVSCPPGTTLDPIAGICRA